MAEKFDKGAAEQKILDAQRESELTQKRIDALNERTLKAKDKQLAKLKEQIAKEQSLLTIQQNVVKEQQKAIDTAKKREDLEKEVADYVKEQGQSFSKLGKDVQKQLVNRKSGENAIATAVARTIEYKQNQLTLEGEDLKLNNKKLQVFQSLEDEIIEQGKHVAAHHDHRNKYEKEEAALKAKMSGFNQDEIDDALKLLKIKQNLQKQEERLTMIHEEQHKMAHILPESFQSAMGYVKQMGAAFKTMSLKVAGTFLLAGALLAAFHAFQELDQAAEDYRRETGMTVSQTEELGHQAHHIEMYYRKMGVELKDVYDSANALANTFSDVTHFSEQTLAATSLLKSNFGVAAETSAEVQGIFQQIGGLSQETAANVQMQTVSLAKQLKVSPKEMMEDIAKSAGITSKYFKGDVTLLVKQAAEAKRLGTNLQQVEKTAENLLDFENSIEKELVAATFVGGQFNLNRARALAYEGKIVEAQNATLDAIEASGDFASKDVFTQKALAEASNMTVEEINKQLAQRKQLASLSEEDKLAAQEALNKGLDITGLNEEQLKQKVKEFSQQQEINGQLTQMENSFKGIIAQIGGTLMPLMTALVPVMEAMMKPLLWAADGITMFVEGLKKGKAGAIAMAVVLSPLLFSMIGAAVSAIYAGLSFLGPFGVPLAIAAVAGYLSSMSKAKAESAGDFVETSSGKTQISTREGGLVELSKNDDVVAFPGAAKALSNTGGGGETTLAASPIASSNNNLVSALIQEFRGVRADMASGRIGVYMDGDKVTSNVATVIDRSTRNKFALQ
jgi:hypothetical protein